nr:MULTISPECIES: N-acetylmuramoyl-L-alanine amidase [Myxococcaceae]
MLLLLLAVPTLAAERRARVVIDPGHGGAQDGAKGAKGYAEKQLALQLSRRLEAQLTRQGVQVTLTRTGDKDVPLPERVAAANREAPDLFVSLHANSMPTRSLRARTEGIETYFLSASASGEAARRTAARENAEAPARASSAGQDTLSRILQDLVRTEAHADASRLAYAVHPRLIAATRAYDRGVQQAPFFVLMGVEAPAILVEVGFISHPEEGARLATAAYQERVAGAIAQGVQAFLEETRRRDAGGQPPPVARESAP